MTTQGSFPLAHQAVAQAVEDVRQAYLAVGEAETRLTERRHHLEQLYQAAEMAGHSRDTLPQNHH